VGRATDTSQVEHLGELRDLAEKKRGEYSNRPGAGLDLFKAGYQAKIRRMSSAWLGGGETRAERGVKQQGTRGAEGCFRKRPGTSDARESI